MSQKGKRPSQQRPENDGDPPVKRRKGRPPGSTNKDHSKNAASSSASSAALVDHNSSDNGLSSSQAAAAIASTSKSWQPKPHNDLKSIYNRSAPEAPAELFRKDLISAMKLPDSEPLSHDEYWLIVDQWKQEWERGVQVPVNPDALPQATVNNIRENYIQRGRQDFKLPKNKYIRITKDESFSHEQHYLSHTPAMAESVCAYDLDQCDEAWLKICNGERALGGLSPISDTQFERVVEELEVRCWDKIHSILKNEEGFGIEYDENVICDVCRSPDSEEANEMVFCDNCNICVHQACYGITAIPSGQWLCRTCTTGIKPDCVLCPNKGGAMKSTKSGTKWAHVSCALWIPEVSIGSVDRMEPITKISNIPQSRWALNCILCREKVGACIQCSVKTCKTAYHVTCAFQHGLEMRAIIEDEHNEDGVKLRSYCQKHSTTKTKKDGKTTSSNSNKTSTNASATGSGTEGEDGDGNKRRRTRKEMTTEERNQVRAARLAEIESEFHKHVNIKDISCHLLDIDQEGINYIYNYWILKRKSGNNRPLLPPKNEDAELASQKEENQEQEKMRMFVQLRQDLERVRNLCYMVSRREKLSRSFFKLREQTFHKQVGILADLRQNSSSNSSKKLLDDSVLNAVIEANHGPSIYDKIYSSDSVSNIHSNHSNSEVANNIDVMIDRLMNITSSSSSRSHKSPRQAASSIDLGSNSSLDKINLSPHKSRQSVDINGINNNNKKNLSSSKSSSAAATESRNNTSDNLYKRATYVNGTATSRRSASLYSSAGFSSDSDHSRTRRTLRGGATTNLSAASSSDENDEEHRARRRQSAATPIVTSPKASSKTITARRRSQNTKTLERKRRRDAKQESATTGKYKSNALVDTSSDDETNQRFNNARSPRNRTLQQMEKELHDERSHLSDSTDSDELTGICYKPTSYSHTTKVSNAIYSDSDSTDKDKTDNTASDSQQHPFRTKAAMKEFNLNAVSSTSNLTTGTTTTTSPLAKTKQPPKGILKNAGEKTSLANVTNLDHNKEKSSKSRSEKSASKKSSDFPADLLVVPQRQAAKKASENLMRTNPVVQQVSTFNKKDSKSSDVETNYDSKLSRVSSVDEMSDRKSQKSSKSQKTLQRQESNSSDRDTSKKEKTTSSTKKENSFIEALPYVPQRQAAKKAAEHIKSTVLKPSETAVVAPAAPEPEVKTPTKRTSSSKKDEKNENASESSSSESDSSSSSGSSSGSGSKSSSSSSDDSEPSPATPAKVTQKRQSTSNQKAAAVVSNRRTSDKAKDLPFLDKGNKSAGTVFCSSESDSDSKSSSDESDESQKRNVPAKITKRKSSSAVSHKSTSSGVGTSTGTNATSSSSNTTGRGRGRPRTKSVFKENESSSQGSIKEPEIKTPTKTKDEPARRLSTATTTPSSTNTTPGKATTRGRRDSKVQISENTTPSSRRRPSDVSPRTTNEPSSVEVKPRRHSTRRDSLTTPLKEKLPSTVESRVTDKKDTDDQDDNKTTRKRKLSATTVAQENEEKTSKPEKSEKSPERELPTTKADETNDKTGIVTPTKLKPDPIVKELPSAEPIIDKVKTPVKELESSSRPASRMSNPTPEKHKSPVKKPTRTSSDMEIDPMNSPPYIAQLTSQKILEIPTKISDISKNNGPKSIFDLNDDLADTTEPHFEVPPTPLAFTSHHNDWLKVDANEDTEQATLDLVEKLRQNKQKKQNPELLSEQDLNQKTDINALELDIKKPEDSLLDLNKPENDDVFDRPLDKLNPCRLAGLNATQDTIMSQQKQQLLGNQATNCMGSPNFNQDPFMYNRRWNEAEIIARRRSVSSSPASTVSDNTELQQQQLHQNQQHPMNDNKNQTQLHQNIPCSQLSTNQNMPQMSQMGQMPTSKPFDNQLQQQQPMLSQDQIPLQMQNQNQMPHGQQPMVTFPPFNQMQMPQQHRPLKPECMFFNQQQQQQKPLGASPTYQMGPRGMFPNAAGRMPNKDMNIQNYRQTNPMFMNSNTNILENNLLPMGSPNVQSQSDLKIKSSPHSNKNTMMQPDMNLQQQQNLLPPQQLPQVLPQTPAIPDRKSSVQSTVSLADIKKSPAKTVPKLSVRNTYQQNIENMQNQVRSPHLNTKMSPGKSPRQMDMINKQANEKRGKGSTTMGEPAAVKGRQRSNSTKNSGQSNRGRNSGGGNKKGRTKPLPFNDFDFGGTNHSNLAGTAYDLDLVEEENYKLENFRTSLLRDRKKSNDTSSMDYLKSREPSQSPKFSSPKNRSVYSSAANTPTAGTTPSGNTPLHQQGHHPLMTPEVNNTSTHSMTPNSNVSTSLHDMVLPVLPGPVDMRTYSSFDSSANNELFNNHLLGAFDSGTADHTMAEIDEEMEKELQSALKASNSKAKETPVSTTITTTETTTVTNATNSNSATTVTTNKTTTVTSIVPEPVEEASVDSDTMKVSFSDSRNQLKLKIKGPLAPDGYSSSTFIQKTVEQSISQAPAPASSGLRRMRKKELLRQYWNQDANLDDQTSSSMGDTNPSVPTYSLPNRVSGIPKAVDSMSCIPTKEDYKDYAVVDTKKRKKVSGLQRELRQLTGVVEDETVERRRSIGAGSDKSSNASTSGRSRLNRSGPAVGQTLKMKIKIGMNYIEPATEEVRQSDRPPKKRLDNMMNYSLEDLKRDSLNFRKQVYADYDKKEKVKEKGSDKEKKKKKKDKKRKVEVIENNQKFVLKIKKPKLDENPPTESVLKPEAPVNAFDPNAKDPLSTTSTAPSVTVPKLKLKLNRTSGTTDSYTLASKEKTPAKKQNKKQTSTSKTNNQKGTKKDSAPIKKRELTECRLQLEKLDQDTIKKFVSKTNPSTSPSTANAGGSDVVTMNDNDAATKAVANKTPTTVDSHLGAANEINSNSNLNIRSSSNNNTNLSESCNSKKDEPVNMQKNSEQDTVQNSGDAIKPPADQSKDCEVR